MTIRHLNDVGVRRLGERYCHHDLVQASTRFMLQMFTDFSNSQDFLELTILELIELLKHDELNVDREEALFDAIFKWVSHDRKVRDEFLVDLLKCLRYNIMHERNIEHTFNSHPILRNKQIQHFGRLVSSVCRDCSTYTVTDLIQQRDLKWWKSQHRIPAQLIFCIGGWNRGRTLDIAECFNNKSQKWYITDHVRDPAGGRCYFGLEIIQNYVYIVGRSLHLLDTIFLRSCQRPQGKKPWERDWLFGSSVLNKAVN